MEIKLKKTKSSYLPWYRHRGRMVGKISFHKFLIGVSRVQLREVLFKNHVLVIFEKLPLVDE